MASMALRIHLSRWGLYTLVPTAFLRRAQPPDGKVAVEFHAGDALEACQQL